jgi:hypothetical protein
MKDYHSLLSNVIFLRSLLDLDLRTAGDVQARPCRCGGPLHRASYPRVPLGLIPEELQDSFSRRQSFCCGSADCRQRTTPPSVCFLGRRQYFAATFVILSMLRHGVTDQRTKDFHALAPAEDRTLARWRDWWCCVLPATSFWRAAGGRFATAIRSDDLPDGLLARFVGDPAQRMTALLQFLSELSTTSCRSRSAIAMVS